MKPVKSNIENSLNLVKPYVGKLTGKQFPRAILKTALVNKEYIIATDSYILIRMKHNEEIETPYLHHFTDKTKDVTGNYPNIDRLMPNPSKAQTSFSLNVVEWYEAHDLASVAAKQYKNANTSIEFDKIKVYEPSNEKKFNEISFTYSLDSDTGIEKVVYNCTYMKMLLATFKKLKLKEVTCYFYGNLRPMLFMAGDVEVILLPIREIR